MVAAGHLVSHIDYKRTNNDLAKCKRKSYIAVKKRKKILADLKDLDKKRDVVNEFSRVL